MVQYPLLMPGCETALLFLAPPLSASPAGLRRGVRRITRRTMHKMFPWAYCTQNASFQMSKTKMVNAFCFLRTQMFGTFTFYPSRGQAGCSPRRHAARQTRPVHRPRPHRHTITNTTHVTQIRVHLKSSPPPQPTSRPPLARAARPRVPRRRRARRRKQQGRRKSTSGLSCPGPRSRSSAACAPAPCRPPSARPART